MISPRVRAILEARVVELMRQAMVPDDRVALARAAEAKGVKWALELIEEER